MTTQSTHPDWNHNWSQLNIRGYAEKAAQAQSGKKDHKPTESVVKKYEFILREYMAQIKEHGVAGAVERTAAKYDFMGITTGVVYAATKAWRDENQVPIKYREGIRRTYSDLTDRVVALEEQVAALVLLIGEDKVQEIIGQTQKITLELDD